MLQDIAFALWFMLPAALANTAPVFSARMPLLKQWNAPIDGGRSWRGVRIFGTHKTWRGLVSGIIVATLVLWFQQWATAHTGWARPMTEYVDYAVLPVLVMGPLFGIGALGGDAIESFFKRQRGVKPGKPWFPFDQIDYVLGAIIVTLPFVRLSPGVYLWIIVLWFAGHIIGSYVGWLLSLKKDPI